MRCSKGHAWMQPCRFYLELYDTNPDYKRCARGLNDYGVPGWKTYFNGRAEPPESSQTCAVAAGEAMR